MNVWYSIPPLVGFALSIVLSVLVLKQHPYSFLHRIFAFLLVTLALWAFTVFGIHTSRTLEEALWWGRATCAILPVTSVSFYHFVLLLTGTRGKKWILLVAYLLMAIAIGLAATDLLVSSMREMWYGSGFITGSLFLPYGVVFYGIVVMGIYHLAKAYHSSLSSMERNRYVYIALGATFCLLGLGTDILAARGILNIYPLGIMSNILSPLVVAYAMLRYHLLDFYVVLRTGTTYVAVSALTIGVVAGVISLAYLFGIDAWALSTWMKVTFIILLVLILQPAGRWTQSQMDGWFHRRRYDYLRALESLGEETRTLTDLGFITGSLVNMVSTAMKCRGAAVLLPDAEDKWFIPVANQGLDARVPLRLRRDSVLVWWLKRREETLSRADINDRPHFKALTAAEKEMLDSLEPELFVPLLTRDGLRGILILGRKLSEQDYSAEETRMLRLMARQMATTLDNARLYDLQVRRYREQALLAQVGTTISAEFDLEKIYNLLFTELKKVVPLDFGSINLMAEKGPPITAFMTTTLPGVRSPSESVPRRSESMPAGVAPEPYYNPDLERERKSPVEDGLYEAGIRSLLRIPLQSKGSLLGNLVLAARAPDAYSTEDIKLLQQLAIELAIGIEKSRLYDLERKARLELERQDKERTDFVTALIHEIRTPLTAMVASTELLHEELPDESAPLGALAQNLDVATHNLDRRIAEMADFAKVQSMETLLRLEPVDLYQVVRQAAAQVAELFHGRDQALRLELPDGAGYIKADPDRIMQVLLNLLTNASKFSSPQQTVHLRSYRSNSDIIVEVRDYAPPIEPEELELIFKPYYRRSRGKGSGGLGRGLFICKKLIELHSGKIWLDTSSSGNSFKFSLPLVRDSGDKA